MVRSYQVTLAMANSTACTAVNGAFGLNGAQLAKHSKLTYRQLRELVRLGAVSHACSRGVRSGYGRQQLDEARRARRLLELGLSCREAAAAVRELDAKHRPPKAPSIPTFRSTDGRAVHWVAGAVSISALASRSSSEQRLIDAICAAVGQFRAKERKVRAALKAW